MPELIEQTVSVGTDWYGRRVTATRDKDGKWKIEIHPDSQRDDGERIWSLTDQNMRDLVRVFDVIKR